MFSGFEVGVFFLCIVLCVCVLCGFVLWGVLGGRVISVIGFLCSALYWVVFWVCLLCLFLDIGL